MLFDGSQAPVQFLGFESLTLCLDDGSSSGRFFGSDFTSAICETMAVSAVVTSAGVEQLLDSESGPVTSALRLAGRISGLSLLERTSSLFSRCIFSHETVLSVESLSILEFWLF